MELSLNVVLHSCWDFGCVTGTWTGNFLVARRQGKGLVNPANGTLFFLPSVPVVSVWATIGPPSPTLIVLDDWTHTSASTNRGIGLGGGNACSIGLVSCPTVITQYVSSVNHVPRIGY